MFSFVTHYLGFLKHIPGLALVFDSWLKLWAFFAAPSILDHVDEVAAEVLNWNGTTWTMHKYGGLQLNYNNKELGHIHGNGLLDMLLSREVKQRSMADGFIEDHHFFKGTSWISFYIKTEQDKAYAIKLFRVAYDGRNNMLVKAMSINNERPPVLTNGRSLQFRSR